MHTPASLPRAHIVKPIIVLILVQELVPAGGDDFDNVIVDWLIREHLKPAV